MPFLGRINPPLCAAITNVRARYASSFPSSVRCGLQSGPLFVPGLFFRNPFLPCSFVLLVSGRRGPALAVPNAGFRLVGIRHANTIDCVREAHFRDLLEQPCGWPRQRLIGQMADSNVLRPPVGVRALDQDFVRRQLEMPVREMHGETGQFAVPGQDVPDFLKTIQVAVVERWCLVQFRQPLPIALVGSRGACHVSGGGYALAGNYKAGADPT